MATHDTETFTLRYFAATRDALGLSEEVVALSELGERPDVDALWTWLHERYPATRSWRGHVKVAVAMEFAGGDTEITAGHHDGPRPCARPLLIRLIPLR